MTRTFAVILFSLTALPIVAADAAAGARVQAGQWESNLTMGAGADAHEVLHHR